jgi:hypothetical protein
VLVVLVSVGGVAAVGEVNTPRAIAEFLPTPVGRRPCAAALWEAREARQARAKARARYFMVGWFG